MEQSLPVLKEIKLHRPPILIMTVAQAMRERPQDYPRGAKCAHCGLVRNYSFAQMWPIEFVYLMPPTNGSRLAYAYYSQYVYACSEAHAAQHMLSWWDDSGETSVSLPMGAA